MPLINCEINLILTWPCRCFIIDAPIVGQVPTFTSDTKLYVPVVTLSAHDNSKMLEQLKKGLKRRINWNKYKTKATVQQENRYLDLLIIPNCLGENKLFVSSFEKNGGRIGFTRYYLPLAEIKNYNVVER